MGERSHILEENCWGVVRQSVSLLPFPLRRYVSQGLLDYMVHQVGSSEDYDKLARDTGDSSWSWKNIRKFIFVVSPSGSDAWSARHLY